MPTFFKTMKMYSLVAHVLLVLCVDAAFAQFIGPQTAFDLTRQRTLSPQQQGHILSDIQQHQHRFAPPQSSQFGLFDPGLQQGQLFSVDPTKQTQQLQHHTQTIFQPHLNQKITSISDAVLTAGQNQQLGQLTPEEQAERLKELREKQAIIEKHNQFVEKQYEKALKKAQSEHVEFLQNQRELKKKLYQNLYQNKDTNYDTIRYTQSNPRYIYPEETELFKLAVKKYYEEHPTTTTTTTTTPKPTTTTPKTRHTTKRVDPELFLTTAHSKLYSQIKTATESKGAEQFLPTAIPTKKSIQTLEDLDFLQKQYKTQQIKKDDLLAQLRLAIGENAGDEIGKNLTSREISLPNGQTVQIIRTTDPKLIPGGKALDLSSPDLQKLLSTTTTKPPKAILEELTKGVLPPGANFELLKQGTSGLEEVGGLPQNLPNQKKVTFVLLEEQNDGSFKVQGVKGNGEKERSEVDVDSILQKIKEGEIKLPPNTKLRNSTTLRPTTSGVSIQPNSQPPEDEEDIASTPILKTNIGTHFKASSTTTPQSYSSSTVHSTTSRSISSPSPKSINFHSSTNGDVVRQASTPSSLNQNSIYPSLQTILPPKPTNPTYPTTNSVTIFQSHSTAAPTVQTYFEESARQIELPDVLKREGLFAMSRFLRQSGLDTILNETGPYTVFVPSDKAFRTLMVQLGGPEKAEEKFKENPRLLSGLLLHHVIPGAFKIGTLQDEMTGVSLAGTQLRVNQYNMHDLEWNDIKITTINGAKILDERKDIEIPQGIAHSIDRVMFPLPVGDIVQTLQSDRERRFTNFLRALFASGLAETLQGSKTFTLFAPTDKAFSILSSDELTRTVSDRVLARELVMRHLTTSTLYTSGMRYYQIRDSLEPSRQITLSKSSGRVRVNNNLIVTPNIPATNGVIHALDTLL